VAQGIAVAAKLRADGGQENMDVRHGLFPVCLFFFGLPVPRHPPLHVALGLPNPSPYYLSRTKGCRGGGLSARTMVFDSG
jgi:hypothetical protein